MISFSDSLILGGGDNGGEATHVFDRDGNVRHTGTLQIGGSADSSSQQDENGIMIDGSGGIISASDSLFVGLIPATAFRQQVGLLFPPRVPLIRGGR